MITFHPITPAERSKITSYTLNGEYRDNNISICNLCSWHFLNDSSFAILNDQLVIRFRHWNGGYAYTLPFGKSDIAETLALLQEEAAALEDPLRFFGSRSHLQPLLEKYFNNPFEYQYNLDYADYMYLRTDLAELKGRNYQAKRNHTNRFRKKYTYEYLPLTADRVPQCLELADKWCRNNNCAGSKGLQQEQRAMRFALENCDALGLAGGILHAAGDIIAFTYGAPVNHDTFCVHIEKADITYDGAYPVINQEFTARIPEQYTYINREEDLGIPGLRKAKQSYYPAFLLEKCIAQAIPL